MMRVKTYLVALCKDAQELYSCRVEVSSYTKQGARDDIISGRASLYRAMEKAMEYYQAHCRETEQEMQEATSVIASYLGERS